MKYSCLMHHETFTEKSGECPICGMSLVPQIETSATRGELFEEPRLKWRFWLALFLTLPLMISFMFPAGVKAYLSPEIIMYVELLLTTIVVWGAGWPILKNAFQSFQNKKLNMFSLVGTGILIAYLYSLFAVLLSKAPARTDELYFEPSALITTLVLLGQWLESKAIHETFKDIEVLTHSIPMLANLVLSSGDERKVAVEDIKEGELLRVKPGERIPTDGTVIEGQSWVNESVITGDRIPIYKHKGDHLVGGTLNGNGVLLLKVEKVGEEGLLTQALQLLKDARKTSSATLKRGESVAQKIIPYIFFLAFGTALIWFFRGYSLYKVVCHAISVLIIASPTALELSATLPMIVAIGLGARHGVFFKNAKTLEVLETIMTLVIDKAGTLTEGKPLLTKIYSLYPFSDTDVLKFGASVEAQSPHPVAQAIVSGAKLKNITLLPVEGFQNLNGKGVIGLLDQTRVLAGNLQFIEEMQVDGTSLISQAKEWQKEGLTVIFVAFEAEGIGLLAISDPIRFNAKSALQQLHQEKLRVMLATGDSKEAALALARNLGIDQVEAEASSEKKMLLVQSLQAQGQKVAMAGDAINDAVAMAQANVGIALGVRSIKELPQASIYLLKNNLQGVVRARLLSNATMKIIRENFGFAVIYNMLAIPLAAGLFGPFLASSLTPIMAILLMTLSTLFVVSNSLRLRRINLRRDS